MKKFMSIIVATVWILAFCLFLLKMALIVHLTAKLITPLYVLQFVIFMIFLINSTANTAQIHPKGAGLTMLFNKQIPKGSNDFIQFYFPGVKSFFRSKKRWNPCPYNLLTYLMSYSLCDNPKVMFFQSFLKSLWLITIDKLPKPLKVQFLYAIRFLHLYHKLKAIFFQWFFKSL